MSRFSSPPLPFGLIALALALASPDAHAQTPEEIRTAKQQFAEGKQFYAEKRYAEAAAAFQRAYELTGRSELLFNIGQSFRLAGNLREAERYLQQYLAEAPDADNAEEVVDTIVAIQQQIAGELATVQVETASAGRQVFVDDETEPRCVTPCAVTVPPGPRRITLRGEGARELVENVTLEPGQTFQLRTRLEPTVRRGRLDVATDRSDARLEIADRVEGLPLQQPLELEAGDYVVAVESDRRAKWSGQVSVAADETTRVFVPMQGLVDARKKAGVRRSVAYGLWGVSLAAGIGGGLLGVQARDTFRKLESDQAANQFVEEGLLRQGRSQQTAANVMFAVATTSALAGVALFLWDTLSE